MENKDLNNLQNALGDNINLDDIVISDNGCQCNNCIVSDELQNSLHEYDSPDAVPLLNNERQRCEVWSRVMGYYRPTTSYNVGKKSEYDERKCFVEPTDLDNKCGDCITRAA